jgi:hypothetical protein
MHRKMSYFASFDFEIIVSTVLKCHRSNLGSFELRAPYPINAELLHFIIFYDFIVTFVNLLILRSFFLANYKPLSVFISSVEIGSLYTFIVFKFIVFLYFLHAKHF